MDYYEDAYGNTRAQSIIFTAKEGKSLLSREAFEELESLEKYMISVEYDHVGEGYQGPIKYEDVCYKVVASSDTAPCFHWTPLDCFKQGKQSIPGGSNNTKFLATYYSRASITDFDFTNGFTNDFIKNSCREWYNLQTPQKMILGGVTYKDSPNDSVVASASAARLVMATKSSKKLSKMGISKSIWTEDPDIEYDFLNCPVLEIAKLTKATVTDADCKCVTAFAITSVVQFGCSPNGAAQPASCCNGFMAPFVKHPCAKFLFKSNPSALAVGSQVIQACGLDAVDMGESQCYLQPDGVTKFMATYTYPVATKDACSIILDDVDLKTTCESFDSSYANATKCCAILYDASKQQCHCRYADTTPVPDYFTTYGNEFTLYNSKCNVNSASYDACSSLSPPPSPPPNPSPPPATCLESMETYLGALSAATTARTNCVLACVTAQTGDQAACTTICGTNTAVLTLGAAMCVEAASYYENYCPCDANVKSTVNQTGGDNSPYFSAINVATNTAVVATCGGGGIHVDSIDANTCVDSNCGAENTGKDLYDACKTHYADYKTKCLSTIALSGSLPPIGELNHNSCCDAANVLAANGCPCLYDGIDNGFGVDDLLSDTVYSVNYTLAQACIGACVLAGTGNQTACAEICSPTVRTALPYTLNTKGVQNLCASTVGTPYVSSTWTATPYTCTSPPSPPPSPPPRTPTYTTPETTKHFVSVAEAENILENWEKKWLDGIKDAIKDFEHVDVSWFSTRSLEDVISNASKSAYEYIAMGYALVIIFCFFFFMEGIFASAGKPPGPLPAILATLITILSTFASLGFAALYVEAGLKFNAITLQVVPFLALGLGMNDYFVFAKYVSISHGESPKGSSAQYIIKKAYRKAGASITASSVTNLSAFLLGAITPIPAVRAFSIQVAMTVVCNYICAIIIFPCFLLVDLQRHVRKNPEAVGNRGFKTEVSAKEAKDFSCVGCLGAMASIVFRLVCLTLSAGFFAFCASGIDKVKLGLDLEDVVPSSTYIHDYALNSRSYFGTYQISLVTNSVDFASTTTNQVLLEHAFVTASSVDAEYGSVINYLRYVVDETTGKVSGGETCSEGVTWVYDYIHLSGDLERCAAINVDTTTTATVKKSLCMTTCLNSKAQMSYAPTQFNPTVTEGSLNYRCLYQEENNSCVCPWRQVYNSTMFRNSFQSFLNGGERGQIAQSLLILNTTATNDDKAVIYGSRAIFYVEDVFTLEDKLKHIREARKIVDASKLVKEDGATVYPFDYQLYALNEQYLNIERNTLRGLGISVAISFIVMFPLVTSLWLDVILTFVIAIIQIELYGMIHWLDLKLNAVTMVNLIMTVGISIEFVIHEARAFAEAKGTRAERAAAALSEMGPAIFASAVTTFLAILPLVGADYEYFVRYFFTMYGMILFVGLFNALLTLPALLSFVGPPHYEKESGEDDDEDEILKKKEMV